MEKHDKTLRQIGRPALYVLATLYKVLEPSLNSCNVLIGCTGYYSYENPHEPKFPGQENFPGPIVHPQKWQPGRQFNSIKSFHTGVLGILAPF